MLVIAAHPDDEVLGCGGTVAKLSAIGHVVSFAILGEGITSRSRHREQADLSAVHALQCRSREVGRFLGAKDVYLYGLPDNRFDTVPLLDIIKIIEDLIERVGPEAIYTHHGGDLNNDHVVVHRAVMTATRPVNPCVVKELYAFEVASSTEWAFNQFFPVFRPNVFVDIGETLQTKLEAMLMYESEVKPFPHPRSSETLRAIAQRWGSASGLHAAEAFELIRKIQA